MHRPIDSTVNEMSISPSIDYRNGALAWDSLAGVSQDRKIFMCQTFLETSRAQEFANLRRLRGHDLTPAISSFKVSINPVPSHLLTKFHGLFGRYKSLPR